MTTEVPPVAAEIFGRNLPAAAAYHASLVSAGPVRGLNGPREIPVLWERHIINSALLAYLPEALLPAGATVCDLGSGAGLPGIPLAIARPDVTVTLVDPLLRRITYLTELVTELGLPNVEIIRARSGDHDSLAVIGQHDVVTSRALAPLGKLLRWSMPHVNHSGRMIALKGKRAEAETEELTRSERRLVARVAVHEIESRDRTHRARVVIADAPHRER